LDFGVRHQLDLLFFGGPIDLDRARQLAIWVKPGELAFGWVKVKAEGRTLFFEDVPNPFELRD